MRHRRVVEERNSAPRCDTAVAPPSVWRVNLRGTHSARRQRDRAVGGRRGRTELHSEVVGTLLSLGFLLASACGANDPPGTGGACIGMGANCAAAAVPCCSPLICVAGRVCGENTVGLVDAGGTAAVDSGPSLVDAGTTGGTCGSLGESCVSDPTRCCSGLVCIAGRTCGVASTDGGVNTSDGGTLSSDGSASPPVDAGTGRVDSGSRCAPVSSECDVDPCCAGLECVRGDVGATCRDPNSGGM